MPNTDAHGLPASYSGKTLAGSGSVPASGLATGLSAGPWMIETQDLTINYVRVPKYNQTAFSHSLSAPTRTMGIEKTLVEQVVTANYRVKKSHEPFSTSSWTDPQTFAIDAVSADAYGNTYGQLGGSAMGPQGTVNTNQGYYFRRAWLSSDVEVSQTCQGTRHYYFTAGAGTIWWMGACPGTPADGTTYFGSFPRSGKWAQQKDTFLAMNEESSHNIHCTEYELVGAYTTAQETQLGIVNYINAMGSHVLSTSLWGIGSDFTGGTGLPPTTNQGCASYDINRHDFS